MQKEKEILTRAINELNKLTHIKAEKVPKPTNNNLFDGELEYVWENKKTKLPFIVKNIISPVHVDIFNEMRTLKNNQFLVVTDYINPNIARRLKSIGVFYIDTCGNIYLNKAPILIDVKSEKRELGKPKERLYTASGLQVLYSLLTIDDLINKPYREIAATTKSANGTVAIVVNNLKNHSLIVSDSNGKYKFTDKQKLFENWSAFYTMKLKSKKIIGRYNSKLTDWWKHVDINKYNAQWSGEAAAVKTSHLVSPINCTVYIDKNTININRLKLDARLTEDDNGNVELIERFWKFRDDETTDEVVHPILVYVDLLENNDPRNYEIAGFIFKEIINEWQN